MNNPEPNTDVDATANRLRNLFLDSVGNHTINASDPAIEIRVAVAYSPGWFEPCALGATDAAAIIDVCGRHNPGIAAVALHLLQTAVARSFSFRLSPVNFSRGALPNFADFTELMQEGEYEMGGALFHQSFLRQQAVSFSKPLLFTRRSFVLSSRNVVFGTERDNWACLFAVTPDAVFLWLLVSLAVFGFLERRSAGRVSPKRLFTQSARSILRLGSAPPQASVVFGSWLLACVLLGVYFGAAVTTDLTMSIRMPFRGMEELLGLVNAGRFRFLDLVGPTHIMDELAEQWVILTADRPDIYSVHNELRHINRTLEAHPRLRLSVDPQDIIRALKGDPSLVLETTSALAPLFTESSCDLTQILDAGMDEYWMGFVFPPNSSLPETLSEAAILIQTSLPRQMDDFGLGACLPKSNTQAPLPLAFFAFPALLLGLSFVAAAAALYAERRWRQPETIRLRRSLIETALLALPGSLYSV